MSKNINKIRIQKIVGILFVYGIALVFFVFVDPNKLSLPLIILPFLIIFALLFYTLKFFLDLITTLSSHKKLLISLILSIMPTLLLVIQSVTQLSIKDIILSFGITIILVWYSLRYKNS